MCRQKVRVEFWLRRRGGPVVGAGYAAPCVDIFVYFFFVVGTYLFNQLPFNVDLASVLSEGPLRSFSSTVVFGAPRYFYRGRRQTACRAGKVLSGYEELSFRLTHCGWRLEWWLWEISPRWGFGVC